MPRLHSAAVGKIHPSVTVDRIVAAIQRTEDFTGFCTVCGETAYGVEGDARRLRCEVCDARAVYGAEELLIMVGA